MLALRMQPILNDFKISKSAIIKLLKSGIYNVAKYFYFNTDDNNQKCFLSSKPAY